MTKSASSKKAPAKKAPAPKKQAARPAAAKAAAVKKSKPAPKKPVKAKSRPLTPAELKRFEAQRAAKAIAELKKKGLLQPVEGKKGAVPVKPGAKIPPKKPGENETPGDADSPLLDMSDVGVRKMIARAKQRGYVTYDELNKVLPSDKTSSEQIETCGDAQ